MSDFKRLEDYDREFLLRAYEVLKSEGFVRYTLPLIYARIYELEKSIIAENDMDEQKRFARKELIKMASLSLQVKQTLDEIK